MHALRLLNTVVLCAGVLFGVEMHLSAALASVGANGHWPSHQRELVVVDRTGQKSWQEATRWAVQQWQQAGADVRMSWTTEPGPCEPDGERISVCLSTAAELGDQAIPGVQGLVDPQVDQMQHTEASTIQVCSDCRVDGRRRRVIATHELGHVLGLQHSERKTSVMYHTGGSQSPDPEDLADLRAIYAHTDPPPRCGVFNLRIGGVCL